MRLPTPRKTARRAGLRHVSHERPGIRRVASGRGFRFVDAKGRTVGGARRERLIALVIPPAWRDVWICPLANGHLQATGFDDRGRRQYLYHPKWTTARNETKFATLPDFGRALPRIRGVVRRHLRLPGMPREKVLACIVELLDGTLVRVGNAEYASDNGSFGLTTIRNRHAQVRGDEIRFNFTGKSGKRVETTIEDPLVAKIVRRCQELPGQDLFGYMDEAGRAVDVTSSDVNEYLFELSGRKLTAKDFRTWGGTVIAAETWAAFPPPDRSFPPTARELKQLCAAAVKAASDALNNTVATCRKFYVHPRLADLYMDGSLHAAFAWARAHRRPAALSVGERALLRLLSTVTT